MKDDELLTTTITPECAHFLESWCLLSRLTLLDRHCPHSLTFYPAAAVCSQFVLLPLTASEGIIRWTPSRGGKTMCLDGFWSIRASQRRHLCVGGFSGSIAATSSSTFVRRCFRFAVSIARSCKFMRAAKPAAILGCNLPAYMSEINRAAVSRTATVFSRLSSAGNRLEKRARLLCLLYLGLNGGNPTRPGEPSSAQAVMVMVLGPAHCSFAYSALACFRMGMSGSASLQSMRKS